MEKQKQLLRALPKVDECLLALESKLDHTIPAAIVKQSVQREIEIERKRILSGDFDCTVRSIEEWTGIFLKAISAKMANNLRRVINATGVVIHTNLGRSLLPDTASEALSRAAAYYSNLEYNLDTGKRGSRYSLVEELICDLTGAEAALVVNNNAAAVLLVLETIAHGKEVIVSRGQLVEIGGSFRIPDVMVKSGARLVEVGATNRTHLFDYENGISEDTAMLLRVHTSNFRIIGFTAEVEPDELVGLAKKHNLITMEDLGSGSLIDLSQYGLPKEPTVQEVVRAGIDVVTFSGDKLLGGPQAGIIVGSQSVIERIKKNPLNRALRIDKFTLASLEAILRNYYDTSQALKNVPTLSMLTVDTDVLKKRAQKIVRRIKSIIKDSCHTAIIETVSRVGGGAMPEYSMRSWAVELYPEDIGVSRLERDFRSLSLPIIGRIENEKFLLDVRTIQDREIVELCDQIKGYFSEGTDQ